MSSRRHGSWERLLPRGRYPRDMLPDPADPVAVRDAIDGALDSYSVLQELAEEVEDEWMYVQDLTAAHRSRLEAIAAIDGDDPIAPAIARAIETACDEIALGRAP